MTDKFRELDHWDDPLIQSFWLPLYRASFPADERVPEEEHLTAAAAPDQHVLVGLDGDSPVSMARYDVIPADRFGYLMYMAVDPNAVSRGHGRQMFAEIMRRLSGDPGGPRFLIFEVQRPDVATSSEPHQSADRRIDFYRRQGAQALGGVEYVQRVAGQPGVPMEIMARPVTDDVTADQVLAAASALFGDDVSVRSAISLS